MKMKKVMHFAQDTEHPDIWDMHAYDCDYRVIIIVIRTGR